MKPLPHPRRGRLTVVAVALALALTAAAAAPPETLLPAQIKSWKLAGWKRVEARGLEQVAGPEAALLREYGAQRAEQAGYASTLARHGERQSNHRRGGASAVLTVYQMADRSGAYGAYSLRRAAGREVALGEAGARLPDGYVFYQGNSFVRAQGGIELDALQALARQLGEAAGPQASLPALPGYLPAEGLVAGSDRYLLGPRALGEVAPLAPGDWAGFAYGAEAEAARYRRGGAEAWLLLLSYPTPQIAEERLRDFARFFNLNGSRRAGLREVFARRTGTLVVFATGTDSGHAQALLERVRYERQLSWSEPGPPPSVGSYLGLIVDIFVNTGLLLVVMLVLGVVLGFLRLTVRRLLWGSEWAAPAEPEIILLDLHNTTEVAGFPGTYSPYRPIEPGQPSS